MKLTLEYIQNFIKNDPRFDRTIDTDEPGRAFVWVYSPWTWCAADGNRHMESFIISNDGWYDEKPDTVGYFKSRVKMIEKERE